MPSAIENKLSAKAVENAKFEEKPYKISDGGRLFLLVNAAGKYWRWNYNVDGKEKTLALGVYPVVSLADARKSRDAARRQLAEGIDPSVHRRAQKAVRLSNAENTVESVGREWYEAVHRHAVVPTHAERNLRRLELYVFPFLGTRPIKEVTPLDLLEVLRRIEKNGHHETAHRIKTLCGQVWRYGLPAGRTDRDITADLKDALRPVAKETHLAAIVDPKEFGGLLRAIDVYNGFHTVCAALKLTPLLFVRPGELRHMEWATLDLEAARWDYKPSKGGGAMIFPLARQAVEILKAIQPITGGGQWVFPVGRLRRAERPMSENAITGALARMGFQEQMTAHGFRATARTILAEILGYPIEVIEMQLAHAVKDANGRAYNRTTYLKQRTEMMQAWADYLDELKRQPLDKM